MLSSDNARAALTLLAVLLAGCVTAGSVRIQHPGSEPILIALPEKKIPLAECARHRQFRLDLVEVRADQVHNVCYRLGVVEDPKTRINGCASFDQAANTLTVWFVPPEFVEDIVRIYNLGHEVLHGYCGDFHRGWWQ